MCRHCSVDPSFRGFDLRRANARLGRFSPLGVAASIRASARWVGLRAHCFRFSARTASELPLGEFVLPPSVSELPFGGLAFGLPLRRLPPGELGFGLTASAFRHAPLRSCRWASWPSGSRLPLFGMHRFGVAAGRVRSSAFRFGNCPRRVGLRVHRFRFSARTASEWLLGEFVLPPSVSEIATRQVGLRAHRFRFSACTASEWSLGEFVLPPSVSEIATRQVGLRAHRFRFSACTASEIALGGLAFGLTASAFRHVPLRGCRRASWPSGSLLPLFGTHRSAPPHRRSEGRRSTPTRHLFHFKTLIPTC